MPDFRTMFDKDYIGAWDLAGKDVTVTIAKVEAKILVSQGAKKTKKPVAYFANAEKGMALNTTNCKTIAAMYGSDTDAWVGKRITIYPTKTDMGGQTVDCIRVRPGIPPEPKTKPAEVAS